jgi:hypothetical protein
MHASQSRGIQAGSLALYLKGAEDALADNECLASLVCGQRPK